MKWTISDSTAIYERVKGSIEKDKEEETETDPEIEREIKPLELE